MSYYCTKPQPKTAPGRGIWPGRDPIEEGFWVKKPRFKIDLNLYNFVINSPFNYSDYLGLVAMGIDKTRVNCLGYAASGGSNILLFPNNHGPFSLKGLLGKDFLKWRCKLVKGLKKCKCKCSENKMAVSVYLNENPKNKGKSPWTSKNFDWNNPKTRPVQADLHAILSIGGCNDKYTHVSGKKPLGTKALPVSKKNIYNVQSYNPLLLQKKRNLQKMNLTMYYLLPIFTILTLNVSCKMTQYRPEIYHIRNSTLIKSNNSGEFAELLPNIKNRAPCVIILAKGDTVFSDENILRAVEKLMSKEPEIDIFHTYSFGYSRIAKFKYESEELYLRKVNIYQTD